jgi:hypothetical protein
MNKNFDKAFTNKPKKNRKPWYIINTKKYSYHIIVLPLIPFCWLYDKISKWAEDRRVWDKKRAEKIIARVFPLIAEVDKEEGTLTRAFRTWHFGDTWKYKCRCIDKKFAKKFDQKITDYLKEEFEMEGYTKIIEEDDCSNEWYWVTFKKN